MPRPVDDDAPVGEATLHEQGAKMLDPEVYAGLPCRCEDLHTTGLYLQGPCRV